MANGRPAGQSIGSSSKPVAAGGSHIFARDYYRHYGASGDVRGRYSDLDFTSTGSGETLRVRGIANGLLCATGGTINAIHATGRVAAAKTVSGSLNAVRATLEVAGSTPTPGGKLAALRVDSNIVTGWTAGSEDAFIAVGNVGAGLLSNLFCIDDATGSESATALSSTYKTATQVGKIGIKCRINGATRWLLATDTAPTT